MKNICLEKKKWNQKISNSKNRSDLNTNQEVIQDLPINSEIENYKINNDYQISDLRNSDIFDSNSNNKNDNYNHLFRSNSTYFPSNLALIKDKNEKEYIDERKKSFQNLEINHSYRIQTRLNLIFLSKYII